MKPFHVLALAFPIAGSLMLGGCRNAGDESSLEAFPPVRNEVLSEFVPPSAQGGPEPLDPMVAYLARVRAEEEQDAEARRPLDLEQFFTPQSTSQASPSASGDFGFQQASLSSSLPGAWSYGAAQSEPNSSKSSASSSLNGDYQFQSSTSGFDSQPLCGDSQFIGDEELEGFCVLPYRGSSLRDFLGL